MGNSTLALPYSIDDETHPSTRAGSYNFSIHTGKRKSDGLAVTVFKGEKSSMVNTSLVNGSENIDPTLTQILPALHHFRKVQTLIHPHILRVYVTLDTDYPDGPDPQSSINLINNPGSLSTIEQITTTGTLIIVTEEVIPLEDYLQKLAESPDFNDNQRQDAIAWGIQNLIHALTFLHKTAEVAHGNLSPSAIFVTPAGDFKLSTFQLLTPIGTSDGANGPTPHFRFFERGITPKEYRSPERIAGRWDAISTGEINVIDSYSLGVLLSRIYEHDGAGTCGRLPQKIEDTVARLRSPTLESRPHVLPLGKSPIFITPHIQAQFFLTDILTKSVEDKITFWTNLPGLISTNVLPKAVLLNKVLPILEGVISTFAALDQTQLQIVYKDECLAVLPPLFMIASANLSSKEFSARLGSNVIQRLFRVNDRVIRAALLNHMALFSSNLEPLSLNKDVFEPMCSGFSDSSAVMRELTLKSAIELVSLLSPPNLEKLTRYLLRLQSDTEDSIRMNTMIFIGKLAPKLSDISKSKSILPVFVRAMKDTFAPCRLAALKALVACKEFFDEKALAIDFLPAVVPSLIDETEMVREEAMRVVKFFLIMLRDVGKRMSEDERQQVIIDEKSPGTASNEGEHDVSTFTPSSALFVSSKITSSDSVATSNATPTTTTTTYNLAAGTVSRPSANITPQKKKSIPSFSSLSLSDANIGGNTVGWSDEDDSNNLLDLNQRKSSATKLISTNLLPSWTSQANDDFWAEFEMKPAMRLRGTLKCPNSGSKSIILSEDFESKYSAIINIDIELATYIKKLRKEKKWPLLRDRFETFCKDEMLQKLRLHQSDAINHICVLIRLEYDSQKRNGNERRRKDAVKKNGRRRPTCVLCSKKGIARKTSFRCGICELPLCITALDGSNESSTSCFQKWHTSTDLRQTHNRSCIALLEHKKQAAHKRKLLESGDIHKVKRSKNIDHHDTTNESNAVEI